MKALGGSACQLREDVKSSLKKQIGVLTAAAREDLSALRVSYKACLHCNNLAGCCCHLLRVCVRLCRRPDFPPACSALLRPHLQITVRVMNYYQFMNSKVLFKDVRHKPAGTTPMPVMVHISELALSVDTERPVHAWA